MADAFEDDPTPTGLEVCPECGRKMTSVISVAVPATETLMTWTHLCVQSGKLWRFCGTFGDLHISVYTGS